jgi:hypothetical protein
MGEIVSLRRWGLRRCFIAIGLSDDGICDDVCLDSTPSEVRSAIVASSFDEAIINCDDNVLTASNADATDNGVKITVS